MIEITITGTTSKKLKSRLLDACNFYMKQLGFRKRKRTLEIIINVGKYEEYGLCEFNLDYYWPEIQINLSRKFGKEEMIKTLAHELVHAKQFLRKELIVSNDEFLWKGQTSSHEEWEDEAYILEDKLYNEYTNERIE